MKKSFLSFPVLAGSLFLAGCSAGVMPPGVLQAPSAEENAPAKTGVFTEYLKEIYKYADEYTQGYPVYKDADRLRSLGALGAARIYKSFSVFDYDGDGEEELLLYCGVTTQAREEEQDFERELDPGETADMYILCEYDGNQVNEMPGKIAFGIVSGENSGELTFRTNGSVTMEADEELKEKGIKYGKLSFFDLSGYEKLGIDRSYDTEEFIYYSYNSMYDRKDFDLDALWYRDHSDFMMPLSDEEYEHHLEVIEKGDVIKDISRTEFTAENIGLVRDESVNKNSSEQKAFKAWLADIYQKNEIIKGFPVVIEEDEYYGSWDAYRKFAIADFDGDSKDELLVQIFGPYVGGFATLEDKSLIDSAYPRFEMYELNASGEVVNRDTKEYKMHGDLWLCGIPPENHILNSGFTFYDNAVFCYRATDMNHNDTEAFYIFDDDIYRQLGTLGHSLYTEFEHENEARLYSERKIHRKRDMLYA